MEIADIRRHIVVAVFSDEILLNHLVLKGGNALELVHGVIFRGSLDIDLAMQDDFEELGEIENRIHLALQTQFESLEYVVFDFKFAPRPRTLGPHKPPTWGGYLVEFKLISQDKRAELGNNLERMRREAQTIGAGQTRTFKVEISKYEECSDKVSFRLNGQPIFVYSPEMCVLEKLRALCQQLPEYLPTQGTARPRARDFFDIYSTVEKLQLDLGKNENLELCRKIFAAKEVPLPFLPELSTTREFHRPDWDRVRLGVPGRIQDFDFYFDYVVTLVVPKLQTLWEK